SSSPTSPSSPTSRRHRPGRRPAGGAPAARAALGAGTGPVARACAPGWSADGTRGAAARLFVHPNTVRNRVQRFTDATGVDPSDTFGAVNAWWLCRAWLAADPPKPRPTRDPDG
ncbi:helix-turn-helix domain-containing protein, partial [Actinomadura sp. CNU-125]|uniref:helix-turn-helix domain-containing protein n=1 Tax=Actinomadura sp. CNU-125 TaxID=1904961 RepID=UPI0011777AEC